MKLQFEANQDFQLSAIESVADLFDGQAHISFGLSLMTEGGFAITPNHIDLDENDILRNLNEVQKKNSLPLDTEVKCLQSAILKENGEQLVRFPNFSIEMETGTGKTYVYIRTALELYRRYGLQKYIIVVPTVAIREGVLKTFEVTREHLKELYGNIPYRFHVYDSGNLSRLRQFAESNVVEFLVMTIASFNKDANIIRQNNRDQMNGIPPIQLIQSTRPILIIDEPQNFTSDLSENALASLDPLLALRYSATHPKGKEFNRVYRLSPFEAYRRGLVKKIEVAGVEQIDASPAFIRVESVTSLKSVFTIRMTVHVLDKNSTVKEKTLPFKLDGRSLEEKTNLPDYRDYVIDWVDVSDQAVYFTNGTVIRAGETRGNDKASVFEAQIRYTVREHFRKQARLRDSGIKVLSLFFIDRVDNYAQKNGLIRVLFNRIFEEEKSQYPEWKDAQPDEVQGAYFAQHRSREGALILDESKTGDSEKDKDAYDLIMRDKESLLSFPSPNDNEDIRRRKMVSFIFSHSALREGWDNPNIFQICTLNQSVSDMKKRQEIGRGVRLAVNQSGERMFSERINVLTVIANQSYETYVSTLQSEIENEFGIDKAPPKPVDARKRGVAVLKKGFLLSDEFKGLWEHIKQKTYYNVTIDTEQLIVDVLTDLDRAEILKPHITVTRARVEADAEQFIAVRSSNEQSIGESYRKDSNQNVIDLMAHMLQFSSPPVCLTRRTLLQLVQRSSKHSSFLMNPSEFASVAVRIIRSRLADQLVDGIQYHRLNDWYEMTQFDSQIDTWEEFLIKADHSLYDQVIYESEIERQFVLDLEKWDAVKLYVKLPSWFVVPTPVGTYNPDWALVVEPRDEFGQPTGDQYTYLVSETKSTTDLNALRPDEARKIRCGEAHFTKTLGILYQVVSSVNGLNIQSHSSTTSK